MSSQLLRLVPMTPARKAHFEKMRFHNLRKVADDLKAAFDINFYDGLKPEEIDLAVLLFHRRHVYEHKGAEADKKYIEDSGDISVRPKQALHETQESAHWLVGIVAKMAVNLHRGLHESFPPERARVDAYAKRSAGWKRLSIDERSVEITNLLRAWGSGDQAPLARLAEHVRSVNRAAPIVGVMRRSRGSKRVLRDGPTGGGLRVWWRALYGSDADLDDNHLMRMAGRFSRRLRAWAEENNVPVIYCSPGEDKHKMAEHSFHIFDPDWGHLTIKMSGHPPFGAQVILNGHEYVACQAQKAGIDFTKQDNCFTTITSAAELAQVADTLSQNETAGRLRQLCRALDLYNVSLLRSGSGRAKAEHLFLQLLSLPDGIQPQSACQCAHKVRMTHFSAARQQALHDAFVLGDCQSDGSGADLILPFKRDYLALQRFSLS